MKMVFGISLVLVVVMGFAGCAHYDVAKAPALRSDVITNVHYGAHVTFVNAQPSKEDVEVGTAGLGRSLHGNLNQWTGAAISLLQKSLPAPSNSASNQPARSLALSITHAEMSEAAGGWGFKCHVHLDVKMDDGHTLDFVGTGGSWKYLRVCDDAITDAVTYMLKDETVREYLK